MTTPERLDKIETALREDGCAFIALDEQLALIAAAKENARAYDYAVSFLLSYAGKYFDYSVIPLPNLTGVLTQIAHASTVTRDLREENAKIRKSLTQSLTAISSYVEALAISRKEGSRLAAKNAKLHEAIRRVCKNIPGEATTACSIIADTLEDKT